MPRDERHTATIPYGTLGIVPLKSCSKMGEKVDDYLVQWREQREHENQSNLAFSGYKRDSYVVSASTPRFGSEKVRVSLTILYVATIYILWLTYATTALNIHSVVQLTICHLMITMQTLRE